MNNSIWLKRSQKYLLIFIFATLFSGCSSGLSYKKMTVSDDAFNSVTTTNEILFVHVMGGYPKSVTNKLYAQALTASLVKSGLFKTIENTVGSGLTLKVLIEDASIIAIGHSSICNTEWYLIRDGNLIWSNENIDAIGKSQAFSGVKRMRTSQERACKSSIEQGIKQLSKIDLTLR